MANEKLLTNGHDIVDFDEQLLSKTRAIFESNKTLLPKAINLASGKGKKTNAGDIILALQTIVARFGEELAPLTNMAVKGGAKLGRKRAD